MLTAAVYTQRSAVHSIWMQQNVDVCDEHLRQDWVPTRPVWQQSLLLEHCIAVSALAKTPGSGATRADTASAATQVSSPVDCSVSSGRAQLWTDLDMDTMHLSSSMQLSQAFWAGENWYTGHMGAGADWSCGLPVGIS